ncbi:type II toxin-antitoxin system RelE/ParE family toxin [Aeromonas sp. ARM81]|uniref:type II toxin-antitoxin system RelE/ParE family toxin n=1 Tax=Aeromonas sp. ARM81 TaxID=1747384 RepID=UPI000DF83F3F|nr:type II toxin-antitoxin system RelE/ParE family toxin [Aeromonas sp. ARM81]RDD49104.1 Killer protein [Aeromonas sp. ARM81]
MIVRFKHKGLEEFYNTGTTKGIQAAHSAKLKRILALLDVAMLPKDMDLPGYRLHELKGKQKGYWSVTVNGNWRLTFRFINSDVELVNYH